MIYFPNCKINIGLFVTGKREDGFHNIESIFYPIGLNDALEMRFSKEDTTKLQVSGQNTKGIVFEDDSNIVLKAYNMLRQDFKDKIKPMNIYLDKGIPVFAGLGGGSSDGCFALKLIDYMCNLHLNENTLYDYASKLGSDCPFFLKNKPQFVYSKGEKMQNIDISLKDYYIVLIKPNLNISTKESYNNVHITKSPYDLKSLNISEIKSWKDYVKNDFEINIFEKYPILQQTQELLYKEGAIYAQMSGSGSTIYGIFEKELDIDRLNLPKGTFRYIEKIVN